MSSTTVFKVVTALLVAFVIGTVGGGMLAGGDDPGVASQVGFNPDEEEKGDEEKSDRAAREKQRKQTPAGEFTAQAVKEGKRIVISGEGAAPGAELVVQRKESSGWQDFPASASAREDGSYSTYIITSRGGVFRVKDTGSDAASEPVSIEL